MHVIFNNIFVHLQFRKMWDFKGDFTYNVHKTPSYHIRSWYDWNVDPRSHYILCQVVNTLCFSTCFSLVVDILARWPWWFVSLPFIWFDFCNLNSQGKKNFKRYRVCFFKQRYLPGSHFQFKLHILLNISLFFKNAFKGMLKRNTKNPLLDYMI
jgi:hypothetical protein